MKMTISKKIISGFVGASLLLATVSSVSTYYIRKIDSTYRDAIDRRAVILAHGANIRFNTTQQISLLRGYFLDKTDVENIEKIKQASDIVAAEAEKARMLVQSQEMKSLLQDIEQKNAEFRKKLESVIALSKTDRAKAAEVANTEVIPYGIQIRDYTTQIIERQKAQMTETSKTNQEEVRSILMIVASLSIVSILLALASGIYLARRIARPIQAISAKAQLVASGDLTVEEMKVSTQDEVKDMADSFNQMTANLRGLIQQVSLNTDQVAAAAEELTVNAEQTGKASEQITASIQAVSDGTDRQVRSVEESSQAVQEMSVGIQQIAATSRNVSANATEALERAQVGGQALQSTISQMNAIHQTIGGLAHVIQGLGARSKEIGNIIDAITVISSQTNLLALNAAIEAARAGEQGKGFAVVASEVRTLAEQSAASAQQISALIGTIQTETEQAVLAMEKGTQEVEAGMEVVNTAGESFSRIQHSIGHVADQIQEVSTATEQISAGSQQVVSAISHIADITENAAAGAKEVSAATGQQLAAMEEISTSATSLTKMAEELQALVNRFKV